MTDDADTPVLKLPGQILDDDVERRLPTQDDTVAFDTAQDNRQDIVRNIVRVQGLRAGSTVTQTDYSNIKKTVTIPEDQFSPSHADRSGGDGRRPR